MRERKREEERRRKKKNKKKKRITQTETVYGVSLFYAFFSPLHFFTFPYIIGTQEVT